MKKENNREKYLSTEIEISKLGVPGFRYYFVNAPVYNKDHPLYGKLEEILKKPRNFKVVFTLLNPQSKIDLKVAGYSFEKGLKGDSFISIPANVKEIIFETKFNYSDNSQKSKKVTYRILANNDHRWGKIILDKIEAFNWIEAKEIAFDYIAPALSKISFELDVPLHIRQIDIYDLATNYNYMSYVAPYSEKLFEEKQENIPTADLRALYSIYREGLISDLPAYKFLCFYRIIEGIYKLRNSLQNRQEPQQRPKEIIPSSEELDSDISEYFLAEAIGKKFTWVRDNILRPMRTSVAHFLLISKNNKKESGEGIKSFDRMKDQDKLWQNAFLAKYMARIMLQNEINAISKNNKE